MKDDKKKSRGPPGILPPSSFILSPMLHPTAIIHPDARLGSGVTVGPYAVIEGPAQIGDGCTIQAHAVIGGHVVMGKNNLIGYGAIIGGEPQDFAFQPAVNSTVRIGDGNKIREYCTIHRGTTEGSATVVGHGCFLMAGAHLAHNCQLGDHVIIANNALLAGHDVTKIGVFAPLDVLEQREAARGDRLIGLARWQFERVHQGAQYDLTLDTSARTPEQCAADILRHLALPTEPPP